MMRPLLLLIFLIPLSVISADAAITSPEPVASVHDGDAYDALNDPQSVTTVVIDGTTYALVTGHRDNGVQIIDISTPSTPVPVASFFDGNSAGGKTYDTLNGAYDVTTVVIHGTTYALVTASWDEGVQIVNITTPSAPTPVASFFKEIHNDYLNLATPHGITTVKIGDTTYALIAASFYDGVQIVNITTPSAPTPSPSRDDAFLDDDPGNALDGAENIATVVIDGTTYALVTGKNDDGVQIISISQSGSMSPVAAFFNGTSAGGKTYDALDTPNDIATAVINDDTYALIASISSDGVQIVNITTPSAPEPVASFRDGDPVGDKTYFKLDGARSITTVSVDDDTYALVASNEDDGVQIVNITTPSEPTPVTSFRDGDSVGDKTYDALDNAQDITTVVIDGTLYALVASKSSDGVQIVSLNSSGAMSETTPPTFDS